MGSSPRAWGCFRAGRPGDSAHGVFPTCVGVFPVGLSAETLGCGLPHVRGGVSTLQRGAVIGEVSSPRAWGCFCLTQTSRQEKAVFPTCVGVFLWEIAERFRSVGLPHVRGGVSLQRPRSPRCRWSSPRAWGCFLPRDRKGQAFFVFPTCVGVFLYDER